MKLTPGQACYIYGWINAKLTLTWDDIVQNPSIDFEKLLSANLSVDHLHLVQPNLGLWIKAQKVNKSHLLQLAKKWDINDMQDLHVDIGDLMDPQFCVDTLLKMGVQYNTMQDMGLTGENMRLFKHITLIGWSRLGMTRNSANNISEHNLYACFAMKKNEVLQSLHKA